MSDDLSALPSDSFTNALTLLAVALDAKTTSDRLKSLDAKIAESRKAQAAAEKAQTERDAQAAELGKREAAADAREADLEGREAEIDEKYAEIDAVRREAQRSIDAARTRLVNAQMSFLNLQRHPLQSEPTLESLEPLLYDGKGDAHFADEIETPGFEPVSDLVAGSSLTKSKPRRGDRRV
jgi:multidrug efflux pump subunit AcrA (membrane-fusion protein)